MTTSWHFEALGTAYQVSSECIWCSQMLAVLLSAYQATPSKARSSYHFRRDDDGVDLLKGGRSIYQGSREDAVNLFLLDLYRDIIESAANQWLLHAAALVRDGQTLVLAGPSGSGKSTMTRALLRSGWSYLSEEIVSLAEDGLDALRRPMHLEDPTQLHGIEGFAAATAMPAGPTSFWIAAPEGPPVKPGRVQAVVRLYYRPNEPTSLTALSSSQALIELWACRMNSGLQTATIAATLVSGLACYRLCAADETSALSHLMAL